MGKDSGGSAPSPDPNIGKAALKQAETGEAWLDFAREQFEVANERQGAIDDLTQRIGESQLETQNQANQWSRDDRARWETSFRPMEDMFLLDAMGGSYLSDDQVRGIVGQRNEALQSNLNAQHQQRLADIQLLGSQKTELTKVINGTASPGFTEDQARRLAESMLRSELGKITTSWTDEEQSQEVHSFKLPRDFDERVDALAQELMGERTTTTETKELVSKYTEADLDALREAETARYEAQVQNLGTNEDQIFAAREAERNAQQNAAGAAKSDVMTNAAAMQGQQQRQMASMGLNPNSGRFQGIDRATNMNTALAAAGAQNQAREGIRSQNIALRADAANMGRGLPSQAAQASALGLQAGNSALEGSLNAQQSFLANTGIMGQGFGGAMQGYANQASILNNQYQNQLQAWSANQQAAAAGTAGLFGAIGTGLGAYFGS